MTSTPLLYLASQSPRRRELLDLLGVRHELLLAGPDEDAEALEAERAGEAPVDYVERVTRAKLAAALDRRERRGLPVAPVLCADTTVALGERIFGKPVDATDAARILAALSGQTHVVHTAIAVATSKREAAACRVQTSCLTWRALQPAEIDRYVASGEPFGKAGAYAIQGRAAAWTVRLDGSYSGIMGLPLYETAQLLGPLGFGV